MDTNEVIAPTMEDLQKAALVVRAGEPFGRARGGRKRETKFTVQDGYSVFKEKCPVKFSEIRAELQTTKKQVAIREGDSETYLKKAKHNPQDMYIKLTRDNFAATLLHRWKLLAAHDIQQIGEFKSEAFLYVQSSATSTQQFHRATVPRIEAARVRRLAFETANAVAFGSTTACHLDVVHARRPDDAPFDLPNDITAQQAIQLDRDWQELEASVARQQPVRTSASVTIKFNGRWVPVEVDVRSLRRAL